MFKKIYFTGDTHGKTGLQARFDNAVLDAGSAVIILGDAGLNYYLRKKDVYAKMALAKHKDVVFYILHGNHEEYPANIPSMDYKYDEEIRGGVWIEPDFPNICYLVDGGIYYFNGLRTLALGGAYSVDKYWRLQGHGRWFASEQMPAELRQEVLEDVKGEHFDLVLTHTAPISMEPTHLFLAIVSPDSVDKTMELWLEEVKSNIQFDCWLCGHFHSDELLAPKCLMLYEEIFELNEVQQLCDPNVMKNPHLWAYWFKKSPKYYMGGN